MNHICAIILLSGIPMLVLEAKAPSPVVVRKTTVCDMAYWSDTLDDATLQYGWRTYVQFFSSKLANGVDQNEFNKRAKEVKSFCITDEQYVAMGIGNERLERYWGSKTPEEFYPEGDRPRGHIDISSITMLMTTTKAVSPILLGRVKFNDGFEQIVSLDGMHRVIAAHLSGRSMMVCVVDLR